MSRTYETGLELAQVHAFLAEHFDRDSADVALAGAGAWSQCFAFRRGGEELVVRFGRYGDDFRCDQLAAAYRTPDLPIPEVLAIGRAFDGYYAISTRVQGVPLESVGAAQWRALVPSLAAALEAMRSADISATSGYGGWGADGQAPHARWSDHLLRVGDDTPQHRTHGWRARLATRPDADATFARGFALLGGLASIDVPRFLIHADLINRNVLVSEAAVAGIFDWGCAIYGDHLYDLAWFEFWSPWYPELDMDLLRGELERRWRVAGYAPERRDERLAACYLHIGLDHLAYNAHLADWDALTATAERMRALVPGV
jgi:hygromycin-B 4-O-kinase